MLLLRVGEGFVVRNLSNTLNRTSLVGDDDLTINIDFAPAEIPTRTSLKTKSTTSTSSN